MSERAPTASLDIRIQSLLAAPDAQGHPLAEALAELYQSYQEQEKLLDRISRIADRYQRAEYERGMGYAERYQKQIHQLDRLLRISDRYHRVMQDMHEELRRQSIHDELTGLFNRRHMLSRLAEEAAKQHRHGTPFAVAICDVDHFKQINDTWGHDVGDAVLKQLAGRLADPLRQYDICARWGGEEFLILLPMTGESDALAVMEKLRQHVHAGHYGADDHAFPMSVSIGVGVFDAGKTTNELLCQADAALYRAKRQGRNQVCLAG